MSQHRETHDGTHKVTLPPHLRAWFDRQRTWHKDRVRLHAETRWVADGTKAQVTIFIVGARGTRGRSLQKAEAQVIGGRLVGPDSVHGIEHALDWRLSADELEGMGLVAEVEIADYEIRVTSQLLPLDLQPFTISG
jgi:hypothetical protein